MATDAPITHTGDAGILARLIRADDTSLPPGAAKALLRIRFTEMTWRVSTNWRRRIKMML